MSCPGPKGLGNPLNFFRGRDWGLQFFPMNQEFRVSAGHKPALITSLPFVHTARRYYRLSGSVRLWDLPSQCRQRLSAACGEERRTVLLRGSKSRNKVSVGEPAEGSLPRRF